MESITLNGVTFRWNGDDLIITMPTGQHVLSGSHTALLFDFLQHHQQEIFEAEQGRALPAWARPATRYVRGQLSFPELPSPLIEGPDK